MRRLLLAVAIAIILLVIVLAVMSIVEAAEVQNPIQRGMMFLFALGAAGYTYNDVREAKGSLTRPLIAIAIGIVSIYVGYAADQGTEYYGKIFNNAVENASRDGSQLDSTRKAIGDK